MSDATSAAPTFTIGEEVLYDDRRWVIGGIDAGPPERYRLLATTGAGARIVWVARARLSKLSNYTLPHDDTAAL